LALVTSDIAEAVSNVELILCPAPAFAQYDIARQLAPHLADGQVVFLPPATFGSMIFAAAARDAGNHAAASFAETGTLPWLTRKHGPFEVAITIRAKRLPVGIFPLKAADHALDVIGRAFPGVIEPCGDALSAALMNAGPIIHPPLIVMNAGPIEHFECWDIHKEGTQAAIRRVTDALDAERIAVRKGLGYGGTHFPLAHHYATEGEQWMYGRGSHDRLTDSGDWRERIVLSEHRYMREDLRLGLSFLVSVAELAGVATPLAFSFLAIGGAICATNCRPCCARDLMDDHNSPRHRLSRRRPHGSRHRGGIRVCRPRRHHDRRQGALRGAICHAQSRGAGRSWQDARESGAIRIANGP
jgi:opine dehydrogenase